MPTNSKAVANHILDLAKRDGKPVTVMQLVKLAYIAHGWHLAITEGPLLDESVEAWKFGPVVPSLYHEFKRFGSEPITDPATKTIIAGGEFVAFKPDMGTSASIARDVVDKTWEVYSKYTGGQLMALTHMRGTPWWVTWYEKGAKDRMGVDIPDDLIKAHFKEKADA